MTPAELHLTIERLIDDELSLAEERALLSYLEANPEHWRACALAFVEHRALARGARSWLLQSTGDTTRAPLAATIDAALRAGATLSPASAVPAPPVASTTPSAAPARRSPDQRFPGQRNRRGEYLSIAAGLAVAFALGGTIREYWPASDAPAPSVAQNPKPQPSTSPSATGETQYASTPVPENVRLNMVSNGGEQQSVEVPLVPMDTVDERLLRSWQQPETPAPLPPDVLEQFRKEGHEVRQQKSWLQVELPDGRRALVPYERLIVRPTTQ